MQSFAQAMYALTGIGDDEHSGMREMLDSSGLASVYENREGIPFPAQESYWPGRSHDSSRFTQNRDALSDEQGSGTRYGMLIQRVPHRNEVALAMGASNVFFAACAQQDNYIVMGEMTRRWRQLLAHKDFAAALELRIGKDLKDSPVSMLDLFDGAGTIEAVSQRLMSDLLSRFQSSHAVAVLSAAVTTIMKQPSALFHASAFKNPAALCGQMLIDRMGGGKISYMDMLRKDFFEVRHRDSPVYMDMLKLGSDVKWTRFAGLRAGGCARLRMWMCGVTVLL